ncbi:hypothetical protein [Vibrio owensii]|uniref:hypothetical protein n=1 Tax=Vibrio owensii TaxID=696485 RepID=UPI0018F1B1FC|nr:hypothetical protein [Vibrio owensii]
MYATNDLTSDFALNGFDENEFLTELSGWDIDNINDFEFTPVEQFRKKAIGLIMASNFLERLGTWRSEIRNHAVFSEPFENNQGVGDLPYYQVIFNIVDRLKQLIKDNYVLMAGVSFGKDSSALLVFFLIAYGELKNEGYKVKNPGLVLHTGTRIEQPEVSSLAVEQWNTLIESIAELQLPIEMRFGEPTFSSSFLGRVVTGRAMPTISASTYRECSSDLKVTPGQQIIKNYIKEINKVDPTAKPCLLLGVRDEEGTIRASSISEHGGQEDPLAVTWLEKTQQHVCYPIKDFTVSSVWEVLTLSGKDKQVIPSMIGFERTVTVYADSSGECVFLASDKKEKQQSSACGARHGCALCVVSGSRDKSMDALLQNPKYEYLRQLSRVREYLFKTHFDWNDRNLWARSINKFGYAEIKPEAYSFNKCRTILHALLTADCLEQIRAREHEYMLRGGELDFTEHNRRMAKPQFQFVTKEDLLMIEFQWGLHQFSSRAFEALNLWHEVYANANYEMLEWIDDFETIPNTPQPKPMYIYIGSDWSENGLNPGLRDHELETVLDDPSLALVARLKKMSTGDEYVYYTSQIPESSSIEASEIIADAMTSDGSLWLRDRDKLPLAGPLKLLRMNGISIAKGRAHTYFVMAQRAQWWRGKGLYGDMSMEQLIDKQDELKQRYGTVLLTKAEYIEAAAEMAGLKVEDPTLQEMVNNAEGSEDESYYYHFQADMFSESFVKVETKVKKRKASAPKVQKPKVKTSSEEQLDMF